MKPYHYLVPALIATTAHASELTLEAKPFNVSHDFRATALPESVFSIRLEPKAWTQFEVVSIADHGSLVKKGSPLIVFDSTAIDQKIADTRQTIATSELELAQAKLDLATLEKTLPEQLERAKRKAEIAAEELAYFLETRRDSSKQKADHGLKRQRQMLASYQEELKQLLQMYEADDITEDTEEIILQKQRDAVEYAEFALRMEILDHKRKLEVALPREEVSLTEARDDSALAYAKAQKDLPRSLELKKLDIAKLQTALGRQHEALANLEHDRKLFEIQAPEDGLFYFGAVEKGKWVVAEQSKNLTPKAVAPVGKTLGGLIPSTKKLVVQAFLSQADASALEEKAKGYATLSGQQNILISVTLSELSEIPNIDGTYQATFTAEWPDSIDVVPGQKLDVRIISYSQKEAVAVPSKALELGADGWTIEVKLADGKTERRKITRGKTAGELTEITDGAEAGQVVIVPSAP